MTLLQIKQYLRNGRYAWPGGYPLYFVTADGAALSFDAVRAEWRNVVQAHLWRDRRGGWFVEAVNINWEDVDLHCDHTGKRIEAAYED